MQVEKLGTQEISKNIKEGWKVQLALCCALPHFGIYQKELNALHAAAQVSNLKRKCYLQRQMYSNFKKSHLSWFRIKEITQMPR